MDLSNKRLMLAPMAGVNDVAFRELCIDCGAQLTYTEMISSKALDYSNAKTLNKLQLANNEDEVVVQLFGHEPDVMARQAAAISNKLGKRLAYIDINMGCPAPKIVKKGDGSALMNNPKLAFDIVKAVSSVVETCVKFRNHEHVLDFANKIEQAGSNAMCIHPRYANQFYKGEADWDVIKKIKLNSSIPIIGSGDIMSFDEANEKLSYCDAIMIGRAARGNPGVFSPNTYDRIELAKRHLKRYYEIYGGDLHHMRKHCIWYVKGMPGASKARLAFNKCESLDDFMEVLNYDGIQG